MASFIEALEAASKGHRVKDVNNVLWAIMHKNTLCWIDRTTSEIYIPVHITSYNIKGDWIIEPLPPKEYTFMEAVGMMERGKIMRSLETGLSCRASSDMFYTTSYAPFTFTIPEIKGKWVEVT